MKKNIIIPKPNPMQVAEGLKMLMGAYQENHRVTQEEVTKRQQIEASKQIELKKIKSQRKLLEKYFEGIFSERRIMIKGMFDALDKGIETNNFDLIQQSLASVVDIAKESPLAGIQNLLSDYNNPDVDVIEI